MKLLNIPVWEALAVGLGASGVPNTFQNRRVSSAAAEATVQPSGLCSFTTLEPLAMFTLMHNSMQILYVEVGLRNSPEP